MPRRGDGQLCVRRAVHENGVAQIARHEVHGRRRIGEGVVGRATTILEEQGNIVLWPDDAGRRRREEGLNEGGRVTERLGQGITTEQGQRRATSRDHTRRGCPQNDPGGLAKPLTPVQSPHLLRHASLPRRPVDFFH